MVAGSFTKKKPYLDTEDTLEEVVISRRQLNYWREKGLFTPEFGEDAKKFTEKDIKLLKFARRLIVEQQFPVEVAKRLIEAATSGNSEWQESDLENFQYLDVKSGTLLSRKPLDSILWGEFGASASEFEVEQRLYDLVLLLFRLVRSTRPSPAAYKERRDEVLGHIHTWEMVARLGFGPTTDNSSPHIHVDPKLDQEFIKLGGAEKWLIAADKRLKPFEMADSNIELGNWGNSGNWGRFYSAEAIGAANEAVKQDSAQNGANTFDEIPWDDGEPPF
jgi:DNA-binding transcriptional MerR regulator